MSKKKKKRTSKPYWENEYEEDKKFYDSYHTGINMTQEAFKSYQKMFNNPLCYPVLYTPKKNWHKQKYLNKQKEIKKRAKTNYPRYITNQSNYKQIDFAVHKNPEIEVYYTKNEKLIGKYYHDEYSSFTSLKNKEGNIFYQRKHSSRESRKYSKKQHKYQGNIFSKYNEKYYEEEFTEVVYVYYKYFVRFKNNNFSFCSNKIIDQNYGENEIVYYNQEKLNFVIEENLDSIFDVLVDYSYNRRFKNKESNIFTLVNNINKIQKIKYYRWYRKNNEYDSPFYDKFPHYKSLMKRIDNETHFYSGMDCKSKGKTKLNNYINKTIKSYNELAKFSFHDSNSKNREEIIYKSSKEPYYVSKCNCSEDCSIEDIYYYTDYNICDYLDDFDYYSSLLSEDFEAWDYVY